MESLEELTFLRSVHTRLVVNFYLNSILIYVSRYSKASPQKCLNKKTDEKKGLHI